MVVYKILWNQLAWRLARPLTPCPRGELHTWNRARNSLRVSDLGTGWPKRGAQWSYASVCLMAIIPLLSILARILRLRTVSLYS